MPTDTSKSPSTIILFMVDQLSAKWLEACEGCVPTPHFDRLRQRGTAFTNTISSNPLCMPARATLATGLTTRGHGVLQNGYQLNPAIPTFMQQLQRAGYATGLFGKCHFEPHFKGPYPDYKPYGFDVTHITEDQRMGEWIDWVAEEHPDHLDAALATIWAGGIPALDGPGPDGKPWRERWQAARENFDFTTPTQPQNTPFSHTLPFPAEVSQTEWITSHALHWLGNAPADQSLFTQISYVQPHGPFCPPESHLERVDVNKLPEAVPATWQDDPNHPPCLDTLAKDKSPEEITRDRHLYFADIAHLDDQLGKVMQQLEDASRLDDSWIIFTADHGEMLSDHGMRSKGEMHYDACLRVPLVIAGPGLQAGHTCNAFVQLEDLCPTVLDMAQVEPHPLPKLGSYLKDTPDTLPGQSLLPWCRGQSPDHWRDAAYAESYNNISSCSTRHWARTIRTPTHRYTYYPSGGGEQLFDLQADPDELNNLAHDAAHADTRQSLRDRLMELIILQDYPHTPRDLFAMGVH